MAMETTLILVKPDGVQRGLIGEVVRRIEKKGLQIVGLKMLAPDKSLLEQHYAVHASKPFYASLLAFMSSGPVVAIAARGDGAIDAMRTVMGPTDGRKAAPGTIRGDFGMGFSYNLVHGSDGPDTAKTELAIWFPDDELINWDLDSLKWVYER